MKRDVFELLKSFKEKVLDEQWSVEGWIHEEKITIHELDDTVALASVAIDLFLVGAKARGITK